MRVLGLALVGGGCSLPDTIGLGYGQSFLGGPEAPFRTDDDAVEHLGVNVSWQLKPARIEWVEPAFPLTEDNIMDLIEDSQSDPDAVEAMIPPPVDPQEVLESFTLWHPATQIAVAVAVVVLCWMFRERIARLIPGGRNGGNGKAKR